MFQAHNVIRRAAQLAVFAAMAAAAHASIVIPPGAYVGYSGYVSLTIPSYSGPVPYCTLNPSKDTCNVSAFSNYVANNPSPYQDTNTGQATGKLSVSTDTFGGHFLEEGGTAGEGSADIYGTLAFGDTVVNNTPNLEQYQVTFHLDATLFSRSSAVGYFGVSYNGAVPFPQQTFSYGGAGTYMYIDQDFASIMYQVPAFSSSFWSVGMYGEVGVSSQANAQYLAGDPQGSIDAGNTLSLQTFSVFDAQGNPLPDSALTSMGGFDYTATNVTSSAPEPGSLLLMASGLLGAFAAARKKALLR